MNSFYSKIKHIFPDITILINKKNKELELLKYNIDKFGGIEYFMLFSSYIITNFLDLSNYQKKFVKIGSSSNGIVHKISYRHNTINIPLIIKSSKNINPDGLFYEYLVGLCVNEFVKYSPCFSRSYLSGYWSNEDVFDLLKESPTYFYLVNHFSDNITIGDKTNINNYIKTGCINNTNSFLISQYIPTLSNLHQYIYDFLVEKKKETEFTEKKIFKFKDETIEYIPTLISILHLIYSTLSVFSDYFTHNDLHLSNILLIKIPFDKCINIQFIDTNGESYSYKSIYMPIIIDYGRSWIDCKNFNQFINNTQDIMKIVCNHDIQNLDVNERVCVNNCGNKSGYKIISSHIKDGIFSTPLNNTSYVALTNRNKTADLRILLTLKKNIDLTVLPQIVYLDMLKDLLDNKLHQLPENMYGPENLSISSSNIYNVDGASNELEKIVRNPSFIEYNNRFIDNPIYGTLHIYTNTVKPFDFILNDQ
jgi:hypothetical protein